MKEQNQLPQRRKLPHEIPSWVAQGARHFIATFELNRKLKTTLSEWKRYQTRVLKVDWQPDFFEHRLRNQAEFDEKSHYIRMNPVRKNLVNAREQWPHVIDRTIKNGSLGQLALPENSEQIGRANSPSEPPRRIGSVEER